MAHFLKVAGQALVILISALWWIVLFCLAFTRTIDALAHYITMPRQKHRLMKALRGVILTIITGFGAYTFLFDIMPMLHD